RCYIRHVILRSFPTRRSSDLVKACERLVVLGGGILLFGLAAEIGLAAIHPLYDSLLGTWGTVFGTFIVFVGVFVEVWFSGMGTRDRKSTRLNSSHVAISYAVF